MMKEINDSELGVIKLQANARAKRFVVRYRDGAFVMTHPSFVSYKEVFKAVDEMRPQLKKLKEKGQPRFIFDADTEFSTLTFSVKLVENDLSNIYTCLKDGLLTISYSQNTDVGDDDFQHLVKTTIENTCRGEANRLLPQRVLELACEHNFSVGEVKINKSRSRWGSCSTNKNINLSYFCMMLPKHLVDFVILHELCHTIEMNHGPRFWALLDKVSNNRAQELTAELKKVKLKW